MSRPLRTVPVVLLGLLALLAAACGDDDDAAPAAPTAPSSTAPGPPGDAPVIDWSDVGTVDLGAGWELADAEGDGPFVALRRDGGEVGVLEIARYPIRTLDTVRAVLDGGGSEADALAAHAADYLRIFEEDRRIGCGDGYGFTPEPTVEVDGADGTVVRYGFRGGVPVSERNLHWAGLRGEDLVLVTVSANDPDGCLPPEGPTLTVADLDDVEDRLAAAIEASPLPA